MGRPERRLDPADGPVVRFAIGLRQLREQAGRPSYRRMAAKAHYSQTALSEAAGGDRFPSLPVVLGYVAACGGDRATWAERWRLTAEELTGTETDPSQPYLGLVPFQPSDAARFCGREELTTDLAARVARVPLLVVTGPSGSGKSSLLRAGLLATAARDELPGDTRWRTALLTPTADPLRELAERVGRAFGQPRPELSSGSPNGLDIAIAQGLATGPETRALLVVDQFEELFTLCPDPAARERFVALLLDAALRPERRTHVVLGIRADFYGRLLDYPELVAAIREHGQLPVGAMTEAELRRAIVEPAERAGRSVDPELVVTLISEVGGKPGALPLVSHTLRETWQRHRTGPLGMADYHATGGLHGALAQTAERLYDDLAPPAREVCRRILLRLVALGDGTADTRRRASRTELDALGEPEHTDHVLQRLTAARLVVLDGDTAELSHEALTTAWPRLHRWLTDDRDGLRIHRELTDAVATWQALDRDPGALYRGTRLGLAEEWATGQPAELSETERDFLDRSTALARAETRLAERRHRQLRALAIGLSVLLVVAVGASALAWRQRQDARAQQSEARSRQLAAQALAAAGTRVDVAARLAEEAYRTAPTEAARGALLSVAGHQPYHRRFAGHAGSVGAVTFSADGRRLATGGADRSVIVWDAGSGTRLRTLTGHRAPVHAVAFSPNGDLVAAGAADGTIIVWSASRRVHTWTVPGSPVTGLAFSTDGRRLLGTDREPIATTFDLTTGRRLPAVDLLEVELNFQLPAGFDRLQIKAVPRIEHEVAGLAAIESNGEQLVDETDTRSDALDAGEAYALSPDQRHIATTGGREVMEEERRADGGLVTQLQAHAGAVRAVGYTPDGRRLVAGDTTGAVLLWNLDRAAPIATLTGHVGAVTDVAVSPDGQRYVAAGVDGTVLSWDAGQVLAGHTASVGCLVFGPGGRSLLTGGADSTAVEWDVATRRARHELPSDKALAAAVTTAAYSADGRLLATGSGARIRLWDPIRRKQLAVLNGHTAAVRRVAFSPDGRRLVSAGSDGVVAFWDPALRRRVAVLRPGGAVHTVGFSPDGSRLAVAGDDGTVTLLDAETRATVARLTDGRAEINDAAFSPDGRMLAAAGGDGRVLLWDLAERRLAGALTGHTAPALSVAFSPDGSRLASAGLDHTVILWQPADRTRWATLTGHTDGVTALAWHPDGTTLASASIDHTVILWPAHPAAAVETVRAIGRR